ncbi:MAG: histidinol-phosphatase HisJ family protein [Chloroflexi bacterium]|nr:histidinol-phosphatase HisJ family protein [Chloroflexota bacterium]
MLTVGPVAGLVDSHVHSTFSCDGRATTAEMVEQAIRLGVRELTFTEHIDLDPGDDCRDYLRPHDYLAEIERCRGVYGDQIIIRAGVEVGDVQRHGEAIAARLAGLPIDFIIGSVHYIDGLFAGGIEYISTRDEQKAIGDYFEQVLLAAATGGFDVHGHLDVFKRRSVPLWGPFQPSVWAEPLREALRRLIAGGMGIEINTSGVRTDAHEPCPGLTVLEWYRELGGEILTLGSDSHRVSHLGIGLEVGAALARAAGFRRVCTFAARRPIWHDL